MIEILTAAFLLSATSMILWILRDLHKLKKDWDKFTK
jgi:hypothetical protein